MLIYEALKKDHDTLKPLLARLVKSAKEPKEVREELIGQIRDELIPHSRAEEAVFYNSLREISEVKAIAWHGYAEHAAAETMLRTLQAEEMLHADWTKLAESLKAALEHHIEEEEGEMFNAAKSVLANEEAELMTGAFEQLKEEVKDESFAQTSLDLVANMMPPRFSEKLRSFNHPPQH